jgi:hypothetical protein
MNNRGPTIDREELHVSMYIRQRKKILVELGDFTSTFCLLLVK